MFVFVSLRILIIPPNNIDLKKKKTSISGYVGNLTQIVGTLFTTYLGLTDNIGNFVGCLIFNKMHLLVCLKTLIIPSNNIRFNKKKIKYSIFGYVSNLAKIVDTLFTICL